MTREEAIGWLKDIKETGCETMFRDWSYEVALDLAIESLSAVPNCKKCAIKELWKETEKEDLVSVVRCKDCKNNYYTCTNHGINQPMCDFTDRMLKETDFCSRGERREE